MHVIWLKNSLPTIQARLADDPDNKRGIIGLNENGLEKLFTERMPLYAAWADHTIESDDKSVSEIASEVLAYLDATQ